MRRAPSSAPTHRSADDHHDRAGALNLVGCNINGFVEPRPTASDGNTWEPARRYQGHIEFLADDIEDRTGVRVEVPLNRRGRRSLRHALGGLLRTTPARTPSWANLMLFHEHGLDYTMRT